MIGADGLYKHIRKNDARSGFVLFSCFAVYVALSFAFIGFSNAQIMQVELALSGAGHASLFESAVHAASRAVRKPRTWFIIIALGGLWFFGRLWLSTWLIRRATGAKPLDRNANRELYDLVENIAMTVGLPCPEIEVVESDRFNAYAHGLAPSKARLGLTTGLIRALTRDELAAVVAHEITHVRNHDTRFMAVLAACVDLVLNLPNGLKRRYKEAPFVFFVGVAVLWVPLGIMGLVIAAGAIGLAATMQLWLGSAASHAREFIADAGAIEITKDPAALISAIEKIAENDGLAVTSATARAMMFSGPSDVWGASHPTRERRVAAIMHHAKINSLDVAHARRRMRGQHVRARGRVEDSMRATVPATGRPAFGKRGGVAAARTSTNDRKASFGTRGAPSGGAQPWRQTNARATSAARAQRIQLKDAKTGHSEPTLLEEAVATNPTAQRVSTTVGRLYRGARLFAAIIIAAVVGVQLLLMIAIQGVFVSIGGHLH